MTTEEKKQQMKINRRPHEGPGNTVPFEVYFGQQRNCHLESIVGTEYLALIKSEHSYEEMMALISKYEELNRTNKFIEEDHRLNIFIQSLEQIYLFPTLLLEVKRGLNNTMLYQDHVYQTGNTYFHIPGAQQCDNYARRRSNLIWLEAIPRKSD